MNHNLPPRPSANVEGWLFLSTTGPIIVLLPKVLHCANPLFYIWQLSPLLQRHPLHGTQHLALVAKFVTLEHLWKHWVPLGKLPRPKTKSQSGWLPQRFEVIQHGTRGILWYRRSLEISLSSRASLGICPPHSRKLPPCKCHSHQCLKSWSLRHCSASRQDKGDCFRRR